MNSFINDIRNLAGSGPCNEFSESLRSGKPATQAGVKCVVGIATSAISILASAWIIKFLEERSKA